VELERRPPGAVEGAVSIEVRGVLPEEWQQLRALRLLALADAPTAFGTTLEEDAARPEDVWRERATGGDERRTFVAERDGHWLGMATGLAHAQDTAASELVGMFVDGTERGRGVGAALVAAICEWAREQGGERIYLWVTESNEAGIALYRKCGFRPTGERQPLPHTPSLSEMRMVRLL
jgi:GNAT superfamily N-acetyltransferase